MEKMELLWAYMEEDMKADRIASEIRRSPLRQKLEKIRDYILEQQKVYKQMQEQVAVLADRKDAIRDAIARCEDQLKTLNDRFQANPPETLEATQAMLAEVEKQRRTISTYEAEMKRMLKISTDYSGRAQHIRVSTAKAKQDFDQMKVLYEKESQEKKADLEKQRAVAREKLDGIPADLLSEYNNIKKHIAPPMARMLYGACSGCNTSQPSALLHKIEEGSEIVECETCGRILIK